MDLNQQHDPNQSMPRGTSDACDGTARDNPKVDIDNHTWSSLLPAMLAVLQDGSPTGRRLVSAELQRMAIAADLCNQALIALVRLNNRGDGDPDDDATEVIQRAWDCQSRDRAAPQPQAGTEPEARQTGLMAKRLLGKDLELQVCYSAAGFYLGTYDQDVPCTRESVEYWRARELATRALESGQWTQRDRP